MNAFVAHSGEATYCTRIGPLAPIATATDIVTLTGSASKIIELIYYAVYGVATASSLYEVFAVTRSTADSGGTPQTDAVIKPYDPGDPAATATVNYYNSGSNPTLGTAAAKLPSGIIYMPAVATPAISPFGASHVFGSKGEKPVILRGVSQQFAINLGGSAVPAGTSLRVELVWKEI